MAIGVPLAISEIYDNLWHPKATEYGQDEMNLLNTYEKSNTYTQNPASESCTVLIRQRVKRKQIRVHINVLSAPDFWQNSIDNYHQRNHIPTASKKEKFQ